MKHSLITGGLVIALAFTFACKKKNNTVTEPEEAPPVTYDNYSQLKVGNYWIYNRIEVMQNSTETDLQQYDSCYIDKDTVIRNATYFKLHKYDFMMELPYVLYLRDSLHYIVDLNGQIVFSSQDFSTVFNTSYFTVDGSLFDPDYSGVDTLFKITKKMNDKDLVKNVPAGAFKTSNMQTTYVFLKPDPSSPVDNPRYLNARYSKNIGLVSETELFYLSERYMHERRLLRYHLN